MVEFTGTGENRLKSGTAADSYWAMFVDDNTDLIRDYYKNATNEWATGRKKLTFEDGKHGSWWMRQPENGVDINSVKLDMMLTWGSKSGMEKF